MKKYYVYPCTLTYGLVPQHVLMGSAPKVQTAGVNMTASSFSGAAPQRVGKTYY